MSADPRASLMKLPLAEALAKVSKWIEDCEDLVALNPHRDLPRPSFRLDEAWVVVRLAAKERDALERDAGRYRFLRTVDIATPEQGGIFLGITPQNAILTDLDADQLVDAAMAPKASPKQPIA